MEHRSKKIISKEPSVSSASSMTSLTSDQVQAMINAALKEQLETLQGAGRIVDPAAPAANPITNQAATPVAPATTTSQFVTNPYKMDINPAEKQGLDLYNKATEPLPEKEKILSLRKR